MRYKLTSISLMVSFAIFMSAHARAFIQGHPAEPHRHPENQGIKNPVPSTAESIAAGRQVYQRFCQGCHGPAGKGDGSMALAGGTPSNLVDETWDHGSADGEIFVVIRDGTSADMEAYRDKLKENQIWQVINYLRSLAPKAP